MVSDGQEMLAGLREMTESVAQLKLQVHHHSPLQSANGLLIAATPSHALKHQ